MPPKHRLNLPTLTVLSAALKRLLAGVHDVLGADRVVLQLELRHEHLGRHDVLDHAVVRVGAVGEEEDVLVLAFDAVDASPHRDDAGVLAVADVVLAAVGPIAAVAVGREHHVGGVDVSAVAAFGKPERADPASLQDGRGAGARDRVRALPDRAESEHRDLHRVPVVQAVEAEDLGQRGVAAGVPTLVGVTRGIGRRGEERREQALLGGEVEEVGVEDLVVVIREQLGLAALLEPVDGRAEQATRLGVEVGGIVGVGVEQQIRRTHRVRAPSQPNGG